MSRKHNFSAGPAVLPEPVIEQAQAALWELEGCGQGLLETSHRGAAFDDVIVRARARMKRLLGLGDTHEVLFLHGGARTQFYQVPMNLLRGGTAAYLDTGRWSAGAAEEARRFGQVVVPWSSAEAGYTAVPRPGAYTVPEGVKYLHYTSNNTVAGTQYDHVPDPGDAWLVCDTSSDFLSRPLDGSAFDILYGGAQKNLGPAGTTIVVFRKSLLEHCDTDIPSMCRYDIQVKKQSMYNTPCTFAIYVVERVLAWLEDQGGLSAIAERNDAQAAKVYGAIDGSDFWQGKVDADSRSTMNVTFTTGDDALDTAFVAEAAEAGLLGLKGHRSVGGLRASLYNAQTEAAVDALVAFMADFEARRG